MKHTLLQHLLAIGTKHQWLSFQHKHTYVITLVLICAKSYSISHSVCSAFGVGLHFIVATSIVIKSIWPTSMLPLKLGNYARGTKRRGKKKSRFSMDKLILSHATFPDVSLWRCTDPIWWLLSTWDILLILNNYCE
jgi:hypothetical protein